MRRLSLLIPGLWISLFGQDIPPVYFNHVTVFLSPAAYAEVLKSTFLRDEFSKFEERTVQVDGGAWSYTGIYVTGKHTYIELFKAGSMGRPSSAATRSAGQIAFNMWIDDRTRLPLLRDRLVTEKKSTMQIGTARNGQNEPSYEYVSHEVDQGAYLPGISVSSIVKGYYPDGITREKRIGSRFLADREFEDVNGFSVTANEAERAGLLADFRAYGYQIRTKGDQQIAEGPGVAFELVPLKLGSSPRLAMDLSLGREAKNQVYRFGDTVELQLRDRTARWVFTFPDK